MVKILVTSDVHNDLSLIKKLIDSIKKENPDFVILLGDLGFLGEIPKGLFSRLSKYIDSKKIIFVPGNHETPEVVEFWEKLYNIKGLHKKILEVYDILFVGIGGGNVPLFEISDEEIKEFLSYIKQKIKNKRVILLTHVHPEYTKSSMIGEGSKAISEFIFKYKPLLVIHGHIHEAGGLEEILNQTKILNAARSIFLVEIFKNDIKVKKIT